MKMIGDEGYTIDYCRKIAKQCQVNQDNLALRTDAEIEDLAQHIYASDRLSDTCWHKDRRRRLNIDRMTHWDSTRQGFTFWSKIYETGEIPPFTGERIVSEEEVV